MKNNRIISWKCAFCAGFSVLMLVAVQAAFVHAAVVFCKTGGKVMGKYIFILTVVILGIISVPVCENAGNANISDLNFGARDVQSVKTKALKPNKDFGKTPLYFIANKGQVSKDAVFYAKASGYTLWLTKKGMVFDTSIQIRNETPSKDESDGQPASETEINKRIRRNVSRLIFIGANSNPEIVPLNETKHKVNYFRGDKSNWKTGIPTSQAVLYENIYSNIDLKVYGIEKQVEYDWIINPGGNPEHIRIEYRNVQGTAINSAGDIAIETGNGKLIHKNPVSYQMLSSAGNRNPEKKAVNVAFKQISDNTYGLKVDAYDTTRELIIDPVIDLEYSTYLGGSDYDISYEVQVDGSGCAYVCGTTESLDFPTTSGSYDGANNGSNDFCVTKFSASGDSLVYSTYIGGTSIDYLLDIDVDATGAAYGMGHSYSSDFPTVNPYQSSNSGNPDLVVFKLNPAGDDLVYSTYLGGTDIEYGKGIAVDDSGNAYIYGETFSDDFPTENPYMSARPGNRSLCVSKLSASGDSLVYSTYFGGSEEDDAGRMTIDGSGCVYITGFTFSDDFPTVNPYQGTLDSTRAAFVSKFSSTGDSLVYSTFLGASYSMGRGIAVDGEGYAYVVGEVSDRHFPTVNPYQGSRAGSNDAFVTKFTPSGDALVYSTYLGGALNDYGFRIAVDGDGYAYITGYTYSVDFPTINAYDGTLGGDRDAFFTMLSPAGNALEISTYFGGSYRDYGYGLAIDDSGNVYIAGRTQSENFPTKDAFQGAYGTNSDAFLAKLNIIFEPMLTTSEVTEIGTTTATGNGDITYLGDTNPTAHGVCWNTTGAPTLADNFTDEGGASSTGAFASNMTGLSPNTPYYVRAYATNTAGTSYGNEVSFTTLPNPPSAPTATAATSVAETSFSANWNAATGATGYRLDVSTESDFSSYVPGYQDKDVGNVTTSSVTGLTGNTAYYYRVRAVNAGGTSGNSNTVSLTTTPSAPTATAATSVTGTSFSANWNAATGATGYRLDVSTESDFSSYVSGYQDKDVGNVTTSSASGLSAVTEYFYRVRACNEGGASENSNTISVTTTDGTGVPAEVQDAGPNGGDGNGDGILDGRQTTVASLPSATSGDYLTVEITGCDQIEQVQAYTYESVGASDPGYSYPFGLLGFEIPCSSATVRIYYHGADNLEEYLYRKYGPTPDDWNASLWYEMPGVTFGTEDIGGETVPYVEFTLTEGQLGDDTNVFPIVDQGGPAQHDPPPIPTLNEWGMIMLFLLMAGAAFIAILRRKQRNI